MYKETVEKLAFSSLRGAKRQSNLYFVGYLGIATLPVVARDDNLGVSQHPHKTARIKQPSISILANFYYLT